MIHDTLTTGYLILYPTLPESDRMEYTKYVSTRTVLFQELGSYNVALYLPTRLFTARCSNLKPVKKKFFLVPLHISRLCTLYNAS